MSQPRKLHVKSFGCQMNVYDSHRMADTLAPEGFVETAAPEGADLIILNTCHIREKAVEKVYSELGRMRKIKDEAALAGRLVLEPAQAAELGIDLFGRFLTDVARIEDDKVGPVRGVSLLEALSRQRVRHTMGIVDVHLTTE